MFGGSEIGLLLVAQRQLWSFGGPEDRRGLATAARTSQIASSSQLCGPEDRCGRPPSLVHPGRSVVRCLVEELYSQSLELRPATATRTSQAAEAAIASSSQLCGGGGGPPVSAVGMPWQTVQCLVGELYSQSVVPGSPQRSSGPPKLSDCLK